MVYVALVGLKTNIVNWSVFPLYNNEDGSAVLNDRENLRESRPAVSMLFVVVSITTISTAQHYEENNALKGLELTLHISLLGIMKTHLMSGNTSQL